MADPLRRRLQALRDGAQRSASGPGLFSRWLDKLQPYIEPRRQSLRAGLQLKLVQAGFLAPRALTVMYIAKSLLALALPAAVVLSVLASGSGKYSGGSVLLLALIGAGLGWLLPDFFLAKRREARQRALLEGLPDALDLLVACTQAGLGLNAAIERVAEQLPTSHPLLAHELQQVNAQMRAGVDRNTALRNLAEHTGLEDVRGLAALMSQSLRFGTGVAETLRIYAEEFRDRRMQRAEELAGKVGTKLIFPLVLCIFPAFFVVAIGPAVLGVMRALGN
jgi:tight adherence protein C